MRSLQRIRRRAFSFLFLFLFPFIWGTYKIAVAAELFLTWTDNADSEEGFFIERSAGTGEDFSQIATVAENVVSYLDPGLAPGTPYCYRVQAFNAGGRSEYSNISCATTSTLIAAFESQDEGLPVSGIAVLRGWAFDSLADGQISGVKLFVDGSHSGDIPCCSARGDVQAAFPEFSLPNTLNSGWGTVLNWGLLSPGTHTVQLEILSTTGNSLRTRPQTVVVVKPGDFDFLDRFDLSQATASIEGNELVLKGVIVRDSATLQEKKIDAYFRWLTSSQSLGMIEAVTVAEVVSQRSPVSSTLATLPAWLGKMSVATEAQANAGIMSLVESPQDGQTVSGVGILRGWAFSENPEASIAEIQFLVDGQLVSSIPCCTQRGDIAASFPGYANALHSGWGITFNYGLLQSGPHTISIHIRDSAGAVHTIDRTVTAIRLGEFEFLDQFDLAGATTYLEGEEIVVQGVWIRDQLSQQEKFIDVRFRWFSSSQALGVVATSG